MIGLMRRSPRPVPQNRKLSVCIFVDELVGELGTLNGGSEGSIFVDVKWKGPRATISYLRKSQNRGKTSKRILSNVISWNEIFEHECVLVQNHKAGVSSKTLSFQPWDVNFVFRKVRSHLNVSCSFFFVD